MKLVKNQFVHGIAAGNAQCGLWISMCSPVAAEISAWAGFDWALIDMEHSANDYLSVMSQLHVFASSPTVALVRPEANDPVAVKRLLDLGVQGLLFPMVQSVEEAKSAVAATRYPPHGIRGVSGSTRANKFGRVEDYAARVETETAVLLQLETREALGKALEIAAVDGVDGIFFGPADIAADMGLLGRPLDDAVWAEILPVAKALMEKGIPVGTLVTDPDFAAKLIGEGFTFVACGTDTGLLAQATSALAERVKPRR
ncbi:HpcH/HpaI aldolase/citrate lyase family protein [Marinovum sp. 2_MG-2023]|uniref:HpcH/HpaI aldolase family protein n=1 Tax=unclassified Marinovum TaxID=2647166 RepID=UPI0026E1B26F|nr:MULTISPECIES: HpcH/HpaI aldolase/citrate lyase family protein [unclassified Marinovum]MDO6730980.1 HpcH/HpaI aldolase/citrate lyase family protein [Marinovum sp. 2_MG-2023]MDO6780207.1 HpcH/HpaI aldolase/citrate lyase family protein [Marinovum sp. 1_MG-2023]